MPYNTIADLQSLTLADTATCDNPCCILTLDCCVELMGNITLANYTAHSTFATLPDSMHPNYAIKIPVYLGDSLTLLTIANTGEMSISSATAQDTLFLNGVLFNVCDQYYNSSIGNNFAQGTSPLLWEGE